MLFEDWYGTAAPDKPHAMHSVSKSFTATAVGMCVDEGLLKVTDKLVDFFPDNLPEEVSDNLAACTADTDNLQAEQDLIYKYIFPALAALD